MELELDKIFFTSKNGQKIEDRYRYLLTRIHELGSIVISLLVAMIVMVIDISSMIKYLTFFPWFFVSNFIINLVVYICILWSRNYYRKNLDALTMALVNKDYRSVRKDRVKKISEKIPFMKEEVKTLNELDKLKSEERRLRNEMENSLSLAAYEERRLVDAKGYDRQVSEKIKKSYYEDASKFRKELLDVRREIEKLTD